MKRCVLVVGLDRSGTSATARLLHNLGVKFFADQWSAIPANPTGYIEHAAVNNDLDKHRFDAIEQCALQMQDEEIWGLKDPRLSWPGNLAGAVDTIRRVAPDRKIFIVETHRDAECIRQSRIACGADDKLEMAEISRLQAMKTGAVRMTELPSMTVEYNKLVDDTLSVAGWLACFLSLAVGPDACAGIDKRHRHYE